MKKVALVYHFYVHYRIPVLNSLVSSEELSYFLIGDTEQTDDIKRIDFKKEKKLADRFLLVNNKTLGKYLIWQKGLLKMLKKEKFDAVIFLGDVRFLSTWVAMALLRISGKKSYLWSHGIYGKESWLHLQVKLLFAKLATGLFLYNNKAKEHYLQYGFPSDKLVVIYNSLNFKETEFYRNTNKTFDNNQLLSHFENQSLPVVFCIGRLTKIKKIPMLLEAMSILKEKNVLVNCFIIGDGEDKSQLLSLATALNIEGQVHFTGAVYNEKEISRYIMVSDLCVCPGAVGLTGIHALSYGVPVLTNDNFLEQMPEHEAITPGITGDFYKEGDVLNMAEKIQECLNHRFKDKDQNIKDCLSVIHEFYNPEFQKNTINNKILSDLR